MTTIQTQICDENVEKRERKSTHTANLCCCSLRSPVSSNLLHDLLSSHLYCFSFTCVWCWRPHIYVERSRFRDLFVCHFCAGALFCLCFSLIFFFADCINKKNAIEYEYESWWPPVRLPPLSSLRIEQLKIKHRNTETYERSHHHQLQSRKIFFNAFGIFFLICAPLTISAQFRLNGFGAE